MENERTGVKIFSHFFTEEDGASSVEYAILVSLIAAVIALTVSQVGTKVMNLYQSMADSWT